MYSIGQQVWVKDLGTLGKVSERGWMPQFRNGEHIGRRAFYIIDLRSDGAKYIDANNYMTGSDNLRAADWCCDSCDRWLPGQPHRTAPDGEYPNGLHFCFLCSAPQVVGYDY